MNLEPLPTTAFIAPDGTNKADIECLLNQFTDLLVSETTSATERSPLTTSPTCPPTELPSTTVDIDTLHNHLSNIVEGSMNPAHPGYIGHMDSIPTTASVLGDLFAAALNNNMYSVEMSPVFSRLEASVISEVTDLFGLGPNADGVMTSGGTLANIQALTVARNSRFDVTEEGIMGHDCQPTVFVSEVAHTSLKKAAMLLGLGTDAVVPVETDENSRLNPTALVREIERTMSQGHTPFCVVATAGTTTTGNIDPLAEIHRVASKYDLWFHIDAAYGGALIFSDAEQSRLDSVENADSITFNPQKWLYVAKTAAMVLFRDADEFRSNFMIGAPYMGKDDQLANRGEISIQGTRHADILKLWLSLQHIGVDGYGHLVDEAYRLTSFFVDCVKEREFLELASVPETNLVCFRATINVDAPEKCDELNERLQRHLLEETDVFLSLPHYQGNKWLRAVLLNPYTDRRIVEQLFEEIDEFVDDYDTN